MAVQNLSLFINGVPNASKATALRESLEQTPGIRLVFINWRGGTGDVTFDDEVTSVDAILAHPELVENYQVSLCGEDYCNS